ncbi:Ubiquitin carboxyl-terminal hydrolase isozyme L5 [Gossypium australe]|uniref:Ubiquitin carboxyl-terminal hydrolase isozyme L5 n=1 Tax=Gossypium australe TaxID=47621 RepID=A0A5B6UJM7_9ROSI|nr:Ubiquitin carboxyl-terminal hydrolase isozyme L5 [Gossypium australe]
MEVRVIHLVCLETVIRHLKKAEAEICWMLGPDMVFLRNLYSRCKLKAYNQCVKGTRVPITYPLKPPFASCFSWFGRNSFNDCCWKIRGRKVGGRKPLN